MNTATKLIQMEIAKIIKKGKIMAYETREMSGSAFRNNNKRTDNHPDFTGEAKIDGQLYWFSVWLKQDKNGKPWLSSVYKKKDTSFKPTTAGKASDLEDEIPF